MEETVLSVQGLSHSYGGLHAVDNISFDIKKGQVFSFLGPNGAGKTTTINLLITLLPIQQGKVTIAGYDVQTQKDQVRRSIGVVFQDQRLDRDLTVWETLDFHGKIYSIPKEVRNQRISELLELVELIDKKDEYTKKLSGGMKRRLEIARGLLVQPTVLFLDEPTIGLDTQTRQRIWSYIKRVKQKGVTVLLTTHYMDEADQNSDVVCIIDKGKIIANGTPEQLKRSLNRDCIQVQTDDNCRAYELIETIDGVSKITGTADGLTVYTKENAKLTNTLIDVLRRENIEIQNISLVKPTLDNVFIYYTGRDFTDVTQEGNGIIHGH
jgi:ABC-2 type transport system ATP-binding protein